MLLYRVESQQLLSTVLGAGSHLRQIPRHIQTAITNAVSLTGNEDPVVLLESFASIETNSRTFAVGSRTTSQNARDGDNSQVKANNEFIGQPVLAVDFTIVRDHGPDGVKDAKARAGAIVNRLDAIFAARESARKAVSASSLRARYKTRSNLWDSLQDMVAELSRR